MVAADKIACYKYFHFFIKSYGYHLDLHSFPTRRSSDLREYAGLRCTGDTNFARDSMDVYAPATTPHMSAKGMFALLLDDDGDVRANLARDGFRREVEVRRGGNAELYTARCCFQLPIVLAARMALHRDATRGCVRLHIVCRALNVDIAARGIRFDTPSRIGNTNDARDGVHLHVAPNFQDRHTSGSGKNAEIVAKVTGGDRTAGCSELGESLDFFGANGPRGGLYFYGSSHAANGLRTG